MKSSAEAKHSPEFSQPLPWMPVWIGDLRRSEVWIGASWEERGILFHLLFIAWDNDGLPTDMELLKRLVGDPEAFERCWPYLKSVFSETTETGRLQSPMQEGWRNDHKARSKRAQKAAKARWDAERMQSGCNSDAKWVPSESESESESDTESNSETEPEDPPKPPQGGKKPRGWSQVKKEALSWKASGFAPAWTSWLDHLGDQNQKNRSLRRLQGHYEKLCAEDPAVAARAIEWLIDNGASGISQRVLQVSREQAEKDTRAFAAPKRVPIEDRDWYRAAVNEHSQALIEWYRDPKGRDKPAFGPYRLKHEPKQNGSPT